MKGAKLGLLCEQRKKEKRHAGPSRGQQDQSMTVKSNERAKLPSPLFK